ncbi:DUF6223 family protein [Actinophytocola sp.]|uniref:DUF6223 family protein n=1 Tax=Actinophytocola sp. TaxID=1872138 RepID=UPI002ED5C780
MYELAAASVYTMSAGRIGSIVGGLLGLAGVVVGWLAIRSTRRGRAVLAVALGLVGMAVGGVVVATSDSGIGTGNGRGGAYVALLVGLVAVVLGGLALARVRRTA